MFLVLQLHSLIYMLLLIFTWVHLLIHICYSMIFSYFHTFISCTPCSSLRYCTFPYSFATPYSSLSFTHSYSTPCSLLTLTHLNATPCSLHSIIHIQLFVLQFLPSFICYIHCSSVTLTYSYAILNDNNLLSQLFYLHHEFNWQLFKILLSYSHMSNLLVFIFKSFIFVYFYNFSNHFMFNVHKL